MFVYDRRSWYRRRRAVSVGATINAACRHSGSSSGGVSRANRLPASNRCLAKAHHVFPARLPDVSAAAAAIVCRDEAA